MIDAAPVPQVSGTPGQATGQILATLADADRRFRCARRAYGQVGWKGSDFTYEFHCARLMEPPAMAQT
jgi:hypothetical protein